MKLGRPSKYNKQTIPKSYEYLSKFIDGEGNVTEEDIGMALFPSIEGLALFHGVSRKTIYNWGDEHPDFLHIIDMCNTIQTHVVMHGSVKGLLNSTISKVLLGRQGYSEKIEQDTISSDGSMTPTVVFNINPVRSNESKPD